MRILLAVCFCDIIANARADDLTILVDPLGPNRIDVRFSDYTFDDNWYARYALMGRFLLYAALFAALFRLLSRKKVCLGKPLRLRAGTLLTLAYLVDVGFFYSLVVLQAPLVPESVPVGQEFHIQPLPFEPARSARKGEDRDKSLSEHARRTIAILESDQERNPSKVSYVDWQLLMMTDPLEPLFPVQIVVEDVKEMLKARGVKISRVRGFELPGDPPFLRSLGQGEDPRGQESELCRYQGRCVAVVCKNIGSRQGAGPDRDEGEPPASAGAGTS